MIRTKNGKIVLKGILLLMSLATIFNLLGCSGPKKESEVEFLEYRVSGYNPGYDIQLNEGKIIYENFDEGKKGKYRANEEVVSNLLEEFNKLDIYSWNGYREADDEVLDGMGFTLYVKFPDGSVINASGSNKFPKNFREFDTFMQSLMKK